MKGHIREDEEIRYISAAPVSSTCLREHSGPDEEWIRVHVKPGDLLVVPAGRYHRFSLDEGDMIKAMRLFKVRSVRCRGSE